MQVHADLCGLTCAVLGQLRCAELGDEPGPVQLCSNVFELYLALQDVSAMAEYTERSERGNRGSVERAPTTLTTFYTWFEVALHRWLDLAHIKMSNRIRRAVEMNKLCTAELIVRHTTSAMDVSACFYHVSRAAPPSHSRKFPLPSFVPIERDASCACFPLRRSTSSGSCSTGPTWSARTTSSTRSSG